MRRERERDPQRLGDRLAPASNARKASLLASHALGEGAERVYGHAPSMTFIRLSFV